MCVLVAQSCPTFCSPVNCNLPGSSTHGIFQASILEGVAIPFSRGSSQPRDHTQVSLIAGRFFYHLSHWGNICEEQIEKAGVNLQSKRIIR